MIYWTRQKLTHTYQILVWLIHRTFARQGQMMGLGVIFPSGKLHSPVMVAIFQVYPVLHNQICSIQERNSKQDLNLQWNWPNTFFELMRTTPSTHPPTDPAMSGLTGSDVGSG